ncbi:rCG50978, partial [Rattus norvegicus]
MWEAYWTNLFSQYP